MKSNGVVGALMIVVVGGLTAACTTEAVGDGKGNGQDLAGLLAGGKGTNEQGEGGQKSQTNQGAALPAPSGTSSSSPAAPTPPSSPSNPPKTACWNSGNAACDTCANAKCCDSVAACEGNTQCMNIFSCVQSCWAGDTACVSDCHQWYPAGSSLFNKAASCLQGTCGCQ